VPNQGRVNQVFEHAGVPYGPSLEPDSQVCEEAAKKRKQDASTRPSVKREKVSGLKTAPAKTSAMLKTVVAKATHSKAVLTAKVVPGASAPPKAVASSVASVSKIAATITFQKARVLKINTGMKRPAAAPSPSPKGKQAKLDAGPLLGSAVPHKVSARP
jgi:hypothetical protein